MGLYRATPWTRRYIQAVLQFRPVAPAGRSAAGAPLDTPAGVWRVVFTDRLQQHCRCFQGLPGLCAHAGNSARLPGRSIASRVCLDGEDASASVRRGGHALSRRPLASPARAERRRRALEPILPVRRPTRPDSIFGDKEAARSLARRPDAREDWRSQGETPFRRFATPAACSMTVPGTSNACTYSSSAVQPGALLPVTRARSSRVLAVQRLDAYSANTVLRCFAAPPTACSQRSISPAATRHSFENHSRRRLSRCASQQSRPLTELCEPARSRSRCSPGRNWQGRSAIRNFADCACFRDAALLDLAGPVPGITGVPPALRASDR